MKTALHTVSYGGAWPGQVALPLTRVIEKAAAFGYHGVMVMAKRPHASLLDLDREARARLRGLMEDRGVALASIAGYTDFCGGCEHPEVPFREVQVLYVTELARLARDLGGNLVRVFTGYPRDGYSYTQQWNWCVESLRECARRAADLGVVIGVQNHHDLGCHYESLLDLLEEVNEPNCRAMFDAWSPALHGTDLVAAARTMAPFTAQTTVADYVRRPRFRYVPDLVNYVAEPPVVRAVPMGEGFIDYRGFLGALREGGFDGTVAYEMCSPMRGGGSEENLDRCARRFVEWMRENGFVDA
ncbi:MAG: sugar phosphate isomerase/epimerase family protein [Armatimonadota bacterium]|nr:sugar phosphate isomerase/epimerase family protein [Armatimonadota bacterium]